MNWVSQPATSLSRTRGRDIGFASRSWRIRPEAMGTGELPPSSRPGGSTAVPGSWLESRRTAMPPVIDTFTEAWERGEAPAAEDYLHHLDPADSIGAVELIYREYCLAEADGRGPDPSLYLARFPRHREALERLLHLHGECPTSLLGRWFQPMAGEADLPEAGDSIGPYVLRRELGRGSFARVFLAEEADLENRLIVVKVSTRVTREPWLLARARHAHIVEIVRHSLVDDGAFHLICMPFFGGATLGAVLDVRRGQSRAAASGRDLLDDLDRVAAPEYPGAHNARPAREILARLSYVQAIAWIVARLAEALDHAFGREVAHGDVKPSNILLSADGNPMLLDFNLARDGALAGDDPGRDIDPGGTLAYMAPERLRALASFEPPFDDVSREPGTERDPDPSRTERAPHLADLYALGMVLLEALTGRPPLAVKIPNAHGPASRGVLLRSAARVYAAARERDARSIVRDSEIAGGRPIAPGLKTILVRCLDPDPARRYGRALELAEDLDRWRADRPLAYTDEPFWGQAVPRWLRRNRRMLVAAALSLLTVGLVTTALVLRGSNLILYQDLETKALGKLTRLWDDPESRAYRYQRTQSLRLLETDESWVFEAARRVLVDYHVLGPGDVLGDGDWRRRNDVRRLPAADREDLELWILERVYRYCRYLEERPGSPGEAERALKILEGACIPLRIAAFMPLRDRLLAKVKPGATPAPARSSEPAPPWVEEHLLGFVAECEPHAADRLPPLGSAEVMDILKAEALKQHRAAERALGHYCRSLALRPDSYWGHYRAAGMCFGLGRPADAAGHLERCLERRPENPVLRGQLAGCLYVLDRHREALQLCNQALERAPDHAEFYRTRAIIRTKLGETDGIDDDIQQFEMRSSAGSVQFGSSEHRGMPILALMISQHWSDQLGSPDEAEEIAPEEIEGRLQLADAMRRAEDFARAQVELDKILKVAPDHIPARLARAVIAIKDRQFDEARRELDAVLNHPGLLGHLRGTPDSFASFFRVTHVFLEAKKVDEAETIARRAQDLAIRVEQNVARSQYNLAQVYAVRGRSDLRFIKQAAEQLSKSFSGRPHLRYWYRDDQWWLEPVKPQLDAALREMEATAEAHGRMASAPPSRG